MQDSSAYLAPDRQTSLRRHHSQISLTTRPTTSHVAHLSGSADSCISRAQLLRQNRSSYHPPSTSNSREWDYLKSTVTSEPVAFQIDPPFARSVTQPLPQSQRGHRRRSSIADSIRNGFTSVRTLGRRMSLSVRGKRPENERPHVRDVADMFEKEQQVYNPQTETQTPTRHLMDSLRSRRTPSMPILKFTHTEHDDVEMGVKYHRAVTLRHRPECPPGGAGARASAAAQNEAYFLSRSTPLPPYRPRSPSFEEYRDNESGIGIAIDGLERSDSQIGHVSRLDPAEVLAPELVEQILQNLDAPTLLEAGLVSKKWRVLCQSPTVWRHAFYREYAPTRPRRVLGAPKQAGLGKNIPGQDYRKLYSVRKQIDRRWNRGEAAAVYLDGHRDSVYCVQFDEDKIITGSRDNTIRVWDARTYQCVRKLGPPNNQRERSTIIRPEFQPSNVVPFFKMDAVSAEPRNKNPPIWHQASVLCLQYDSEILVTGSSDFTCIVWSIKDDYEPLLRLTGHRAGVLDVCIDATRIITCSKDATIKVWNRFTGTLMKTLAGHRGPVNAVQVRGNLLASASGDTTAKLWRLDTSMCIKEFHSKERGLACVEFSDDGRTIFAGGNDQVIFEFDTTTGQLRRELRGHEDLVRSLHLDSENGRIISGSYDHSIKVWNSRSGVDREDGGLKLSLNGWTSSWMLAAKSNYRKIACASQDGRVVIVDFGYGIHGVELVEA